MFIEQEKANHAVARMCRLFGVSKSGYYAWRARPPSARSVAAAELLLHITSIHAESRGIYGVPASTPNSDSSTASTVLKSVWHD